MLAAEPALIGTRTHGAEHLGGEDQLVPPPHLIQVAARDPFALAERIVVRGIEEVDSRFDGPRIMRARLVRFDYPRHPGLAAVAHASEADARDAHSGLSQPDVFHARLPHGASARGVARRIAFPPGGMDRFAER